MTVSPGHQRGNWLDPVHQRSLASSQVVTFSIRGQRHGDCEVAAWTPLREKVPGSEFRL